MKYQILHHRIFDIIFFPLDLRGAIYFSLFLFSRRNNFILLYIVISVLWLNKIGLRSLSKVSAYIELPKY
ncbi:uncharacterized protein OCT59_004273 [Rhizophagus irregularis]|uniref:uncharacterized protein n=1 Tax=Rhizophagus irregularis TaxID=588596 RepID=UPI00332E11D7|nr:hypothetical protein OCT59_004273 [Rhizophagus irregularis]